MSSKKKKKIDKRVVTIAMLPTQKMSLIPIIKTGALTFI
jgi:hypothetical protein